MNIFGDIEAFETIKVKSRPLYEKAWLKFREFFPCSLDFDTRMPSEEEFSTYFRFLRQDKGFSSSTLWTTYSMLNSVCKGKYGTPLQKYPRLQSLIKAFDVDVKKKAHIFTKDEIGEFVENASLSGSYWLVRKALVIIAFFGGLRNTEVMGLVLEKMSSGPEGVYVVHERAKQRSDQQSSR